MKFEIQQTELATVLQSIGRAVPSRTPIPVMKNILLDVDDGQLLVAAANGIYKVSIDVDVDIAESGAVTVPGKNFVRYITSLSAGPVTLELLEQELHVEAGRSTAHFSTTKAEEFPVLPKAAFSAPKVKAATFVDVARKVAIASSTDDSHPILKGLYVEYQADGLYLAAADGFRASQAQIPYMGERIDKKATIPNETLDVLLRLSPNGDWMLMANENQLVVTNEMGSEESFSLESSVLGGQFPDVTRLCPDQPLDEYRTVVTVTVALFREILKRAMIFGAGTKDYVRIDIWEEGLDVTARDSTGGGRSKVGAGVQGEPVSIGLNGRYLDEFLSVVDTTHIDMLINSPSHPVVFHEANAESGQSFSYVHVLMPMATRNTV